MNSQNQPIILRNSVVSRIVLLAFLLPIILGGSFVIVTQLTTLPLTSLFIGVVQIGFAVVGLASGWSSISYDSMGVISHIPLVQRKSVLWDEVTAYRLGWMTHELLREGRPILKIPALTPSTESFWEVCERRGIPRKK